MTPIGSSPAWVEALARAVALVHGGRRFLVTAHAHPDGDAIGSMLATAHGLRALGKEVRLYDQDPAPARLRHLPGAAEITAVVPTSPFDATFVHDCGDAKLLGAGFPGPAVTGPLVVLDHHARVRPFGDVVLRDPDASAVGVIVARLLAALEVGLTPEIAAALWCSLVSDTGWFRYPATDVETLTLARDCVAAGASPWGFAQASEEAAPVARLRLLREVLGTLHLVGEAPAQVAILHVTDQHLSAASAQPEHSESFVNYARGLEGVEVGLLLARTRQGVRVSLRSKGRVDVGAVAAALGGGGHRGAAGCLLAGALEDAERQVLERLLPELGRIAGAGDASGGAGQGGP